MGDMDFLLCQGPPPHQCKGFFLGFGNRTVRRAAVIYRNADGFHLPRSLNFHVDAYSIVVSTLKVTA